MDTLALDVSSWDLDLDSSGNLRTVGDSTSTNPTTGPGMRLAQDCATRCMAWEGEVYYDTTQGVDHTQYLGQAPNMTLVNHLYQTEAVKVTGCAQAIANYTFGAAKRQVTGTLYVSDVAGNSGYVSL